MCLGLFMMPLHPSYRAIADCYDRDIDQLVLSDKLGFDEALRLLAEEVAPRIGDLG